jgi:CRP/FNR family transcriptional regulator, cyclic AMP receptor protein
VLGLLSVSSFLETIGEDETAALRSAGVMQTFTAGSCIVEEGTASRKVIVIFDGEVKISTRSPDGSESVIATRGAGELIGELSAIDQRRTTATVTAATPVEALVINSKDFQAFLTRSPRASLWILERVIGMLREAQKR